MVEKVEIVEMAEIVEMVEMVGGVIDWVRGVNKKNSKPKNNYAKTKLRSIVLKFDAKYTFPGGDGGLGVGAG